MRWDLVTKFLVLKKGIYSKAVKSYTGQEDFFKEHFPGKPLVPQPFLLEMMAQTGGVLLGMTFNFEKEIVLAKIEDAQFAQEVAPPCELLIEARIEEENENGGWISGLVSLQGKVVAEARILLAAVETLVEGKKNIVFNDVFMKNYHIAQVARQSELLEIPSTKAVR